MPKAKNPPPSPGIQDEEPEGEWVDVGEDQPGDVTDTPDGGAIVTLGEERGPGEGKFLENLADGVIAETELSLLSSNLMDLFERDREARQKRDEQYAEGIRRTGLGDEAPGGATFTGASKVVHPMLIEASIDFASRAMKELWPADGPVKTLIEGEETQEKLKRASRKKALMNWQLTVQSQEARAELEQALTQVPLGGAQYLKEGWDVKRNRLTVLAVFVDDMLLPFAATNFYTAQRKTHVQYVTEVEFNERVRSGMYRDLDIASTGIDPDETAAAKASNKIEGREDNAYNTDGLRTVFESYVTLDLEGDSAADGPAPYIVSIDKVSRRVLSIYRNWAEDDESREELQWFVELPFIPWRGAYPIGLAQIIGGLAASSTGALRALLDSAHINNIPAGIKMKGGNSGGQTLAPGPGEIVEVEGGLNVDDIRKLFMPMPYNQPSQVLMALLEFLIDAGRSVVRTSLDDIGDMQADVPVGTTMARMEQAMVVYSAIHGRLHDAMGRFLRIQHRLNAMYLDDEKVERDVGEDFATRADFEGPMDIVPVSDPNIFSEAQRFAQVQAVAQRSDVKPQLYKMHEVERRILETLKIPDIDSLLQPQQEPQEQNAVNENVAASLGRGVVAFPMQDHIAHIQTHVAYLLNPMLGASPLIAPNFMPAMVTHLREHIALLYMQLSIQLAEDAAGVDLDKTVREHESGEENAALDKLLAQSSTIVSGKAQELLGRLQPVLQQLMQQAAQYQRPGPMDPTQAQLSIAQMVQQGKQQEIQQRGQLEGQKIAAKQQSDAQKLAADQQKMAQQDAIEQRREQLQRELAALDQQSEAFRQQGEDRRTQAEIGAKVAMNDADNQTAMDVAAFEAATDERVGVSTGTGINPQP